MMAAEDAMVFVALGSITNCGPDPSLLFSELGAVTGLRPEWL